MKALSLKKKHNFRQNKNLMVSYDFGDLDLNLDDDSDRSFETQLDDMPSSDGTHLNLGFQAG